MSTVSKWPVRASVETGAAPSPPRATAPAFARTVGDRFSRALALLAACSLTGILPVRAAQPVTETFAGGDAGWTSAVNGATVTYDDGAGQIAFAFQGLPFPEDGSLVATNSASGGAVTGDYAAAGITLIGFDLLATGAVPSQVVLELAGPAGSIRRSFASAVTQTGVWYSVAASLLAAGLGGWNETPAGCFGGVLADVARVQITTFRNGTNPQLCRIDQFHLGRNHRAEALPATPDEIQWGDLRVGFTYTLQSAPTPAGDWTDEATFVATGAVHTITLPALTNGPAACFRLLQ